MKKRILILSLGLLFLASIIFSLANISFSPGRVLSPAERKSLSSPREAFDIMQKLGLGISKADLDRFLATKFPERLAGVILISVEEDGRAYYIHPDTLEAIYLGRPHEALDILRELGLEDTLLDNNNDDINNIILETQKIEELKDFSHIIPITTNIINPDNISIKERGIIYDYSVLPDIKLVPSLDDYEDKVIDDTVNTNNSYTLNIQNLVPGTYPFFRAYLITSDNQIIYGNTITITSTRNDQTEESALPLPLLPISSSGSSVKEWICGDDFIDERDGEIYRTVKIDDECWFQDNLRTTLYNDGSPISTSNDLNEIMSTSSGLYSWYDNDEENSRSHNYGALYNFAAVVDSRGLCPDGWHLPSILEFEELIKGKNHQDLKDTSWDASSNSSGFSALPAGFRAGMTGTSEAFDLQGHAIGFYTKTIDSESSSNAWALALFNPGIAASMGINEMSFHQMPKMIQVSVRCIEDNVKTITYKSSDGGKISLDDGVLKDEIVITVPFGGSHNQEIIATSNSDYTFTKWSDYNTSSTRLGENNVTDNIVLTTEFFKDDPIFDYCGDKVLDTRDMEIYKTVQIGEQCWFQDNLRYLPVVHDNATYTNLTNNNEPSYGVFGYDGNDLLAAKNYKIGYNNFTFQAYPILGVLYNVSAVDQVTLCPSGWKIPNDDDWIKLAKTISGETSCDFWNHTTPCWKIAEKLKSSSNDIIPWTGTNDSGFTALPVGVRQSDGRFTNLGTRTIFSADTSSDLGYVLANENNWTGAGEYMALAGKQYSPNGYSIRCIKE